MDSSNKVVQSILSYLARTRENADRMRRGVGSLRRPRPVEAVPPLLVLLYVAVWLKGVDKPHVVCTMTDRTRRILSGMQSFLGRNFWPSWLCVNGHIHSSVGYVRAVPKISKRRELLRTWDRGTFALDWVEVEQPLPANAPTLLIIHGLNGNSEEGYVQHCLLLGVKRGWRAVAMNHRGCGGTSLTSQYTYNGAFTGDVRLAVSTIKQQYPDSPVLAAGFSLGANLLVKYLGEEGGRAHRQQGSKGPLVGAMAVSNPWDFGANPLGAKQSGVSVLSHLVSRAYSFLFTLGLQRFAKQHLHNPHMYKSKDMDMQAALSASKLSEFDNSVTVPLWGYENLAHYHHDATSGFHLQDVNVPLLCLNAEDDPVCIPSLWPLGRARANGNVIFVWTKSGGHIGWCQGLNPFAGQSWAEELMGEYFDSLLLAVRKEEQQGGATLPAMAPHGEAGSPTGLESAGQSRL